MWAPSVGLATIAPGQRAIGLPCSPAVLRRLFVVSSLRPRDTGEHQHASADSPRPGRRAGCLPGARVPRAGAGGPGGSGTPDPRGPGRPAEEAGSGLAVLDLLDHAAAELAADQF